MLVPKIKELFKNKLIDAPWLLPCLEEKFDDTISMLTEDCLIYGGALRDILANQPIGGDLDIAVPHEHYPKLVQKFHDSARWVTKQASIPQLVPKGYRRPSARIIANVITFINLSGEEIQLIQANPSKEKTVMDDNKSYNSGVINIIVNVDLRCSGIMMDVFGNVYEVIFGALQDCEKFVLNFNEKLNIKEVYKQTIVGRIEKLMARGWKNNIDLNRFKENPKPEEEYKTSRLFGGSITTKRKF